MLANSVKSEKKQKRTREVSLQETEEYLKRPILKVENLNTKLMNSYQEGHFKNERFAYLKELAHIEGRTSSNNEQKKAVEEQDRIFHESSEEKTNKPREDSLVSSLADSSDQLSSQPSAMNRRSSVAKRGKDNNSLAKKQAPMRKQDEILKRKKNVYQLQSQSSMDKDSDFDSNQQGDNQLEEEQVQPGEEPQPGKRRRRRTKAQMLLAHKIQALKCFLNKKKYIKKKLRPKPLTGPAPTIEEEWKTDLQKYNGLKELIEKEIKQREALMNKIDNFGDAEDLQQIKNEKMALCQKGLLKIKEEKPNVDKESGREIFHSKSSSSSSEQNRKSQKSIEKKEKALHSEKLIESEDKKQISEQDSDSAQAICKGKKKDIQHFKKLIDDNLAMLKQRPPSRRRRKIYVSSHREYRYPKTKPKRKGKELSVKEEQPEKSKDKVQESKLASPKGKEKPKKVEQTKEISLKQEEKPNLQKSFQKQGKKVNVQLPEKPSIVNSQRKSIEENEIKPKQKIDKVPAISSQKLKLPIPSVSPIAPRSQLPPSNVPLNIPPPYLPNNYIKQHYKPMYGQYQMPPPYMEFPPNPQMLNNPSPFNRPMLYHPYEQMGPGINHPNMPHLPNMLPSGQVWKGPARCDCIQNKRRRLTLQPRLIVESIFFRFTNNPQQSRSALENQRLEQILADLPRKKRHLKQAYSDSEDEELHYRPGPGYYKYPKMIKSTRKRYRKLAHDDYSDEQEQYDEIPVRRVVRRIKRPVAPEELVKQEQQILEKRLKPKQVLEINSAEEENASQKDRA